MHVLMRQCNSMPDIVPVDVLMVVYEQIEVLTLTNVWDCWVVKPRLHPLRTLVI